MFGKDHPFSGANECHKAQVERVPVSETNPDGWRWNTPCRCPKFQRLQHVVTEPGAPGEPVVRRMVEVQGCLYTLFPWMQGGATAQANAAMAETVALRRDVQEAALPALQAFTSLAQAAQGEMLRQRPVVAVLPAALASPARLLGREDEG